MSQPLVLAIEPDLRQAAIVKRVVREKTQADVVVVETRDAAMEAIRTTMPDVLLLSALMSPRDEEELMTHLRTLDNAGHLQTHTIPQLASALGPAERSMARGLFSAFRRKKEQEPAAVGGCDPDLFAEEIRVFLQRAADRKRELVNAGPSVAAVRARAKATETKSATSASSDDSDASATSSSWESPFEWKPTASRKAPAPRPEPVAAPPAPMAFDPAAVEPLAPEPLFTEPAHAAPEPALSEPAYSASEPSFAEPAYSASEPAFAEPAYSAPEPAFAEPVIEASAPADPVPDDLPLIVRPAAEEPPVVSTPIIPEPAGISEPLIASEPMFPPEPSIDQQPANARASAPAPVDPWVVHSPRIVSIDPVIEPEPVVAAEPLIDVERVIEVVAESPSYADARPLVRATETGSVSIDLDALPEEETLPAPVSAVHERAVKIVARVQDERPADGDNSEWTRPQPVRVTDRLGPLARWARSEPKKAKPTAVTADDVRALLASLAVPAAVANVRYPQGCRIRRVRVPAGADADASESVGAVILSRRALAEQRSASQ